MALSQFWLVNPPTEKASSRHFWLQAEPTTYYYGGSDLSDYITNILLSHNLV